MEKVLPCKVITEILKGQKYNLKENEVLTQIYELDV